MTLNFECKPSSMVFWRAVGKRFGYDVRQIWPSGDWSAGIYNNGGGFGIPLLARRHADKDRLIEILNEFEELSNQPYDDPSIPNRYAFAQKRVQERAQRTAYPPFKFRSEVEGSRDLHAYDSHYNYVAQVRYSTGCRLYITRRATNDKPFAVICDRNFDDMKTAKAIGRKFHEYGDRVYAMDYSGWLLRFEDATRDVLAAKRQKKLEFGKEEETGTLFAYGRDHRYEVRLGEDDRWLLGIYDAYAYEQGQQDEPVNYEHFFTRRTAIAVARAYETLTPGVDRVDRAVDDVRRERGSLVFTSGFNREASARGEERDYRIIPVYNGSEEPDDWRWRLGFPRIETSTIRSYRTRSQAKMIARQVELYGLECLDEAEGLVLTHPKISLQLAKSNARETLRRHAGQVVETIQGWHEAVLEAIEAWDGTGHPPNTRGGILQQQILGETGKVNRERMNRE